MDLVESANWDKNCIVCVRALVEQSVTLFSSLPQSSCIHFHHTSEANPDASLKVWSVDRYGYFGTTNYFHILPRKMEASCSPLNVGTYPLKLYVIKFTAVRTLHFLKKAVFWDVAPCRNCVSRRFGGTYRLHLQGRRQEEIRELTS
jgi:hypothetical protein